MQKFTESFQKPEVITFPKSRELNDSIYEEFLEHDGEEYIMVVKEQNYYDGEKGYVKYDIVFERQSDKKYFKGTAEDWGKGEHEVHQVFKEAIKKEKVTYYYEYK